MIFCQHPPFLSAPEMGSTSFTPSEVPSELMLQILLKVWGEPMNQADRIQTIVSWSSLNKFWRQQFQMMSATNTWIMTPAHAKYFFTSVKNVHLLTPSSLGEIRDNNPEARFERFNPRQLCSKLNFHIENPGNFHMEDPGKRTHVGLSRIYMNLLHHMTYYSLLPNLRQVFVRHIGVTPYETFAELCMTSIRPPLVPALEAEWAWNAEQHKFIQEAVEEGSLGNGKQWSAMTRRHMVFYFTSIERLRFTPVIPSNFRTTKHFAASMEILQMAPIPQDLQPLPEFNDVIALIAGTENRDCTRIDDFFDAARDLVLSWDPYEKVNDEFCLIA